MDGRNLTMLADFYEFTMANGYFQNGIADKIACFDMFFRKVPDKGGFAIMAGLAQVIEYIENLHFTYEDISYLRLKNMFSEDFLMYLKNFKFACDIWSVPEGTPIFPNEPIITVKGPVIQAQLIETMLLLIINHQSLIATKANRIVRAAKGKPVMELGSRRAQGSDAAIYGARAAYIGGCTGTACTVADRNMGIKAMGTMAHSWVQMYTDELEAFRAYAKVYPDDCTLLVDTYDVLKSGIPNAITVFKELQQQGHTPQAIRIDSGDITYLSKASRKMLDDADLNEVKIIASNSLDEFIIRDILLQGAQIDSFGVGERLITSKSESVFGGVYKLAAVEENSELIPKIKISENVSKITNPAYKEIYRLYDNKTGKAIADVLTLSEEVIDNTSPYVIFSPEFTYKRKTIIDFFCVKLRNQIYKNGTLIYKSPDAEKIKQFCAEQLDTIWDEVKRFENPHEYYVDLSQKLYEIKQNLLNKYYN